MITEKGSIKTATELNEDACKALNKNTLTLGIIYTVCGAILTVLGIVVVIFDLTFNIVILVVGVMLLTLGIILLCSYNQTLKSACKQKKTDEVEFFNDHLILNEFIDGELITTSKFYYKWAVKIHETPCYLFIYNTKATAICIDKRKLSLNEFATVRGVLNSKVRFTPVALPEDVKTPPRQGGFADFNPNAETKGFAAMAGEKSTEQKVSASQSAEVKNGGIDPFEEFAPIRTEEPEKAVTAGDGENTAQDSDGEIKED